jgi:hypothetical protein
LETLEHFCLSRLKVAPKKWLTHRAKKFLVHLLIYFHSIGGYCNAIIRNGFKMGFSPDQFALVRVAVVFSAIGPFGRFRWYHTTMGYWNRTIWIDLEDCISAVT